MDRANLLHRFVDQPTVRLTSFRRDGRGVGTAVSIAVDGPRAYVRTYESSGKMKRIRNNPIVEIAPATFRGEPTGEATRARARLVTGRYADRARRLIEAKHPWLHGKFVPLGHRLTGKRTVYLELTPTDAPISSADRGAVRDAA